MLNKAAELFTALNNPSQLKIISVMTLSEVRFCGIAALMDMTQPAFV
jgi:hypothetical protein